MNIVFDRKSDISIKEQVRLEIAQRIRSGLLPEGQLLPSVRQLAANLQISLVTAHKIYDLLEKDNLIESIRGKGSFVKKATWHNHAESSQIIPCNPFDWQLSLKDNLPRASYWSQSAVRLPTEILDLATASIHHTLLPLDLLQSSVREALQKYPDSLGKYSPYQGDPGFLSVISRYMKDQGKNIEPHQIIVTNGTQQGIDLFSRTFLGVNDVIGVETPCFSGSIDAFRFSHATIQPIPVDHDGIRVDVLEELSTRMPFKAIYTVPTYQNPTGVIMSLKRRRELIEFAEQNQIMILEDDPHSELNWQGRGKPVVPSLKSLDRTGRVVYLKGFSKFLFPGLRLGIIATEGSIHSRLLAAKSITDLGSPLWLQKALIPFFSSRHLSQYITRLNRVLTERSQFVFRELAKKLHPLVKYQRTSGGMHLWLTLPCALSADSMIPAAHLHGIHFLPGSIFYPGEPESNHLRICWTNLSNEDLPRAIDILCRLINQEINS